MNSQSKTELVLLAFILSACSPLRVIANPVTTSEVPSIFATARPPKTTPQSRRPHGELFKRQDQTITCATLDGYDIQWAAPYACSGSSPQCTASGSLLGCCDQGDCTVYETCYNAADSAYCTGSCTSTALVCGDTAPSCSLYNIIDKTTTGVWTAFSCGTTSITLEGSPASGMSALQTPLTSFGQIETWTDPPWTDPTWTDPTSTDPTSSTPSPTDSTTQSATPSSHTNTSPTLHPPPTGPSSTRTSTTTAPTGTGIGTVSAEPTSDAKTMSRSEIGAAAGGAAAGALLIAAASFYFAKRAHKKRLQMYPRREMQNFEG